MVLDHPVEKKHEKVIFLGMLPCTIALCVCPACSIKKLAMNQVANALTGSSSSTVFTGDNDPELVGDALPFAIKMYESLMNANPASPGAAPADRELVYHVRQRLPADAGDHAPRSRVQEAGIHLPAGKKPLPARPRHHPRLPGEQIPRIPRRRCKKEITPGPWNAPRARTPPCFIGPGPAGWARSPSIPSTWTWGSPCPPPRP